VISGSGRSTTFDYSSQSAKGWRGPAAHSNTHRPSSQPCEWKGSVGATRLMTGLSAEAEEDREGHAFRDHCARNLAIGTSP
jgi:hypothetical protein